MAADLLTPADLRRPSLRRLFRGVYAPAWVEVTHELKCEAAGLLLPAQAALTGRSALAALGADLTAPRDAVHVVVPDWAPFGPVRGIDVRLSTYTVVGSRWQTSRLAFPERIAFDVAARRPLPDAVAGLDAGLALGAFERARVAAWLTSTHDHDVCAVREALALADPRAESVPESVVRVVLAVAGISTEPQYVVRHRGRFVARIDLAVPARRLAVEYDGFWHRLGTQPRKDRERLTALREAGWAVVVIHKELLGDHAAIVAAVRQELAQRPFFGDAAASA